MPSLEFYKNLRKRINKKIREKSGGGTRCPNCVRWTWEMEKPPEYASKGISSMEYTMKCNSCGFVSEWFDTGFMGVCVVVGPKPAEERGIV